VAKGQKIDCQAVDKTAAGPVHIGSNVDVAQKLASLLRPTTTLGIKQKFIPNLRRAQPE
jgi:hypothetical protein